MRWWRDIGLMNAAGDGDGGGGGAGGAGGGAGGGADDGIQRNEDGTPVSVRYDRFQQVIAERNQLREFKATAEQQLAEIPGLRAQVEGVEVLKQQFQQDAKLGRLGLEDEEGIDIARHLFGRLPEQGRPADVVAWVEGLKAAPADQVPKALQVYIGQAQRPREGAGTQDAPPPAAERATLLQQAAAARRSGDLEAVRQATQALMALDAKSRRA